MINRVTLVWMPEHSYIKENEIANKLPKQGASNHFYGPGPPTLDVSKAQIKGGLQQWERRKSLSF